MDSTGFPWLAMWAGIGFVFIYSMGERLNCIYGEHLKNIGLIGAAFLLFYWFTSYCPAAATQMAITLLIAAVIFKIILWLIFKLKDEGSPSSQTTGAKPTFSIEGSLPGDDIYEKTIQDLRQEMKSPRQAGFESSESRQKYPKK
ncbi:MAG: hypothetical protein GY841_13040 [FCB group bacterium]|nr:hypothetical protein [FCB group bacterium]